MQNTISFQFTGCIVPPIQVHQME